MIAGVIWQKGGHEVLLEGQACAGQLHRGAFSHWPSTSIFQD